jgi:hypothetical protein
VRPTLLVALTIPFALIGDVLSLGSIVGFVTVLGIIMVSHFRHLESAEGAPFGIDLDDGAGDGADAGALAIAGVKPRQEIEHPLAVVILDFQRFDDVPLLSA